MCVLCRQLKDKSYLPISNLNHKNSLWYILYMLLESLSRMKMQNFSSIFIFCTLKFYFLYPKTLYFSTPKAYFQPFNPYFCTLKSYIFLPQQNIFCRIIIIRRLFLCDEDLPEDESITVTKPDNPDDVVIFQS